MKTAIKTLLYACLFSFLLTACQTSKSFTDTLFLIRKGMPQQEVYKLLGAPDFRRFNPNQEEWEYIRRNFSSSVQRVIIVTFENGAVNSLNSFEEPDPTTPAQKSNNSPSTAVRPSNIFPPNNRPVRVMNDANFNIFLRALRDRPFRDDRYKMIQDSKVNNAFSCQQIRQVMDLFSFDDEKLRVLELISPNIFDPQNAQIIMDGFSFSTTKDKARQWIPN